MTLTLRPLSGFVSNCGGEVTAGESYNVGTGITTSFNEIAEMVKTISKSNSKIVHVKNPFKNYQMFTQADMTKTISDLRFKAAYDLKKAIKEMLEL